jgi:radical SAM protein with 4Fe4S-binding SPASM domain
MLDTVPVRSLNLGMGESACHSKFSAIVRSLNTRGFPLGMTSNGYSVLEADRDTLSCFNDVDISIDFLAGLCTINSVGMVSLTMPSLDWCDWRSMVVTRSISMCLMEHNAAYLDQDARSGSQARCVLAGQALQGQTDHRVFTWRSHFLEGNDWLAANARLMPSRDPAIARMATRSVSASPCGRSSFTVDPREAIYPCPFWPSPALYLTDLLANGPTTLDENEAFRLLCTLPDECSACVDRVRCEGGCGIRRVYFDMAKDPYCPADRPSCCEAFREEAAEPKFRVR